MSDPDPRRLTRAETARRNGARSRGPVTPAGKARSSLNALRHGLAAETVTVLPDEDPDAFAALRAGLAERYAPADPLAEFLVHRLATSMWRLLRAERLEAEVLTTRERRRDPAWEDGYNPHSPEGWDAGRLNAVTRYEAQHERCFRRTLRELEARGEPAPPLRTLPRAPEPPMPGRHLWHRAETPNEPGTPARNEPEPRPPASLGDPPDPDALPLPPPVRRELDRLLAADDWDGLERLVAAGHLLPLGLGPADMASPAALGRALFAQAGRAGLSSGRRRTG